jgi:hypothetical protein
LPLVRQACGSALPSSAIVDEAQAFGRWPGEWRVTPSPFVGLFAPFSCF